MSSLRMTDSARTYIQSKIQKEDGLGLFLTLEKRGCSGYAYATRIVSEAPPSSLFATVSDVSVFLDPLWAHYFDELTIDLEVSNQGGLKQKKLIFLHPKEKNRCGCGESFQVE